MKKGKPEKNRMASRERVLAAAERWRVPADMPCDACGSVRSYHAPLCAESDPALITFWVSTCAKCLLDQRQAVVAYRKVRARGWARGAAVDAGEPAVVEEGRASA